MKKKIETKEEAIELPSSPVSTVVEKTTIDKLEPFGNEDMHKVVNKINEIIDYVTLQK